MESFVSKQIAFATHKDKEKSKYKFIPIPHFRQIRSAESSVISAMNHVRDQLQEIPQLHFGNLEVVTALGRGAKGVVFLARNPAEDDAEWLALKVISRELIERKAKIVNNDGAEYRRVCFEREVLRLFRHPLLPRLRGVLDTQKVVGYAIDYCNGRDLNALRKKQTEKMFSDDVIRYLLID